MASTRTEECSFWSSRFIYYRMYDVLSICKMAGSHLPNFKLDCIQVFATEQGKFVNSVTTVLIFSCSIIALSDRKSVV